MCRIVWRIGTMHKDQKRGERIRELRQEAEMTQDALAAKAQCGSKTTRNGSSISWIEAGNGFHVDMLMGVSSALAKALKKEQKAVVLYLLLGVWK